MADKLSPEDLAAALEPFVSKVQFNAAVRSISKAAHDMEPVTVTVTIGQFKEAREAIRQYKARQHHTEGREP